MSSCAASTSVTSREMDSDQSERVVRGSENCTLMRIVVPARKTVASTTASTLSSSAIWLLGVPPSV